MKLTTLIMLIALLHCSAVGLGQNVSLNETHAPLKKVLESITRQTGYVFFYDSKEVADKTVAIKIRDAQLQKVLDACLNGQKLTYKIVGNTIVLKATDAPALKSTQLSIPVSITVTGQVIDEKGLGLPGVTITLKSGNPLGVTAIDGKFSVTVPDNQSTLVFSFVGYNRKEVQITAGFALNIKMEPLVSGLNEVVVVGYGSSSKTNLATATSSVSSKEYQSAVITTVDQALQGRASGVQVTQNSGEPGSDAVIRVRGNNSLSGDNQPLYVIDGFPMTPYVEASSNASGSLTQNGLYGINPNDVESITVLKDASATAIYGSRGANGVILIKTKSGRANEGKIELVNKTTFGTVNNPYPMMNSTQYAQIINESFSILNTTGPFTPANIAAINNSTDWFKAITRTGVRQDISLNTSGGGDKTNYYISGNYLNDKGTVLASNNNRATVRANVNSQVTPWYNVKAQLSIVRQKTSRAISASRSFPANDGVILDALRASPIAPVDYFGFNPSGIPGFTDGNLFSNPVTELTQKTDDVFNDFSVVNFENTFKITNDLQFVVTLGSNQNLSRRQQFFPPTTAIGYNVKGGGSSTMSNTYSYNANAYLNYSKTLGGVHNLNLTAGAEYNKQLVEVLNTGTSGFDIPSFGVNNIGSATIQGVGSAKADRYIQSAFFRGNYSYKDRYVLNTSVRLDGASPFAANKKYGVFPAVGLAWNLSNEDFMKGVKTITNSKIRGSYGETGSQAIGPYSSLAQYSNAFYQTGTSTLNTVVFPATLGNANLSWERTKQLDAGIDFNLLNNLLSVSFDFYNKETDGLLQPRQIPSQSGFGAIIDNYGSIRNRGIELTVGIDVIKAKDFQYNSKITFSKNKNILLNLGEFTASQYVGLGGNLAGGTSGILQVGQEIGQFYGEKVTGIVQTSDIIGGVPKYPFPGIASNQIPGQWKYQDTNGDGTIDFNDATVLGKSSPDFTYGWNNDITYKNFSINLFFTGSQGNSIVNLTRFYLSDGISGYAGISFNQTQDWYNNRWTTTNPTNNPRYPGVQKTNAFSDVNSSYVENGSYFRLKSATIYYNLTQIKALKNARLFVTGTNIFTITKYTGADPEVGSYGQSLLQQGIDYGSYPSNRTYTIGFSTNF